MRSTTYEGILAALEDAEVGNELAVAEDDEDLASSLGGV
jgi:hypothetical protein